MILWFFGGKIHTNIKQISGHNQVAAGSPDILGSQDIFKFPTPDFQTYNPGIFGISKKSLTTVFKYFSQSLTYRLKQLVLRPLITAEVSKITFQTFDYFKTSQELRILSRSLSDCQSLFITLSLSLLEFLNLSGIVNSVTKGGVQIIKMEI